MKLCVKTEGLFGEVIRKSFNVNGQAYAQTVPYILEDFFPDLKVLHLDKGRAVLEDGVGKRYKVVCSRTNTYDVFPSYTKGYGRDKFGTSWVRELEQICSTVIFVNISSTYELIVQFKSVKELESFSSGVIKLE